MRLLFRLPIVKPDAFQIPNSCPYPPCKGKSFIQWQQVPKRLRDTQYPQVQAWRYQCLRCGRTFRVYPEGACRDRFSHRTKGLAVALYLTRVIAELRKRMESHKLGVDHLIVVVDELSKYAPSFGRETYMLRTLLDITERGRYLGLVLFGAQQFRSQVERRVAGNCATSLYGRIEMEELAQPGYSVFGQAVKEKLAACEPGEVLVRHPHFTQPVFVRFPRPCYLRGSDGIRRYPPQEKPFDVAVWETLRQIAPQLEHSAVKAVIDDHAAQSNGMDENRVSEAMHRVLLERPEPPRVLERFKAYLPKPVAVSVVSSPAGLTGPAFNPAAGDNYDPDDPFSAF